MRSIAVRWRVLANMAIVIAMLATASSAFAGGRTPTNGLYVDDDKRQCRWAQYTTIQAAVDAATPGQRINVCPGRYVENVNVAKTVTLLGARAKGNTDQRQRCRSWANPRKDSIIEPAGPAATGTVILNADHAKLIGFTVQGNASGPGVTTYGPSSGYEVSRNVIRDNVFGLYLNAGGTYRNTVKLNCFYDNNQTGSAAGNGIYSDQGLQNAQITSNRFTGRHGNGSMTIIGAPAGGAVSGLTISYNRIDNDNTIYLQDVQDSRVTCNSISDPSFNGIQVLGNTGPRGVVVGGNTIRGSVPDGWSGINIAGGAPTSNVLVEYNNLRDFEGNGIKLNVGATNNKVFKNSVYGSELDGILVVADTSGNLILHNTVYGSGEHDCHDDSTGTGTAGTTNTWYGNRGVTQNRPGLCRTKKGRQAAVIAPEYTPPVASPAVAPAAE